MLNYAFDHRRPALSSPPLQHSTRQHFYFFSKINVLVPKSGQFYGNHKKKESYTKCIHISTVKAQFWHPVNVSSLTRTTTGNSAENGEKGKLPRPIVSCVWGCHWKHLEPGGNCYWIVRTFRFNQILSSGASADLHVLFRRLKYLREILPVPLGRQVNIPIVSVLLWIKTQEGEGRVGFLWFTEEDIRVGVEMSIEIPPFPSVSWTLSRNVWEE